MTKNNIIICGTSRTGKSTLAKIIQKHSQIYEGYVFEGLFPAYLSRLSYNFKALHLFLFKEYITRPRFVNEQKTKTLSPDQQIEICFPVFQKDFLSSVKHAFGLWWVIADLHAELYYKQLLKAWPEIHFCFISRDPRECVAASLYWENFPDVCKRKQKVFYKSLFSWVLAEHVATRIKELHPENITIINSNDLRNGQLAPDLFGFEKNWLKDLPEKPYYSITENGDFTTPDSGRRKKLLNAKELAVIRKLCEKNVDPSVHEKDLLFSFKITVFSLIKTVMLFLAGISPSLARGFIELLFTPIQHLKRQLEHIKQFVKDIYNY
jgi:hypothetical protein